MFWGHPVYWSPVGGLVDCEKEKEFHNFVTTSHLANLHSSGQLQESFFSFSFFPLIGVENDGGEPSEDTPFPPVGLGVPIAFP